VLKRYNDEDASRNGAAEGALPTAPPAVPSPSPSARRPFDLLPAVDLRGGRVVRLERGDFARETAYADDPVAVAIAFAEAGAPWLHVVDLDGARDPDARQTGLVTSIVRAVGGRTRVEVAGGLRDADAVAAALDAGAARAVVGTAALRDPAFVGRLVRMHGAAAVAIALDVRDDRAVGDGWVPGASGVEVADALVRLTAEGATTFELTAIARDGTLAGPDLSLLAAALAVTDAAVVASAGIRSADDIRAVRALGCSGAIVGKALYAGHLAIHEALAAAAGR
jgi:phosphoribosylformimino-5-aminoimidazole carboxamide ribotide isomerase